MVKKIAFILAFGALLSACTERENNNIPGIFAVMTFSEKQHDFGNINQGDRVTHIFTYTNNGAVDLLISNAVGSCGCTVPEYTTEPVHPGETGEIKVSFNSAGKSGHQSKTVTITANTQAAKETLTIKASIIPPAGKTAGLKSN